MSVGTALGAVSQIPNALRTKELEQQRDLMSKLGFTPDETVSKEIKNTDNGTDLGAVIWNRRSQLDKTRQREIGDQLRNNPSLERDFRSLLGNRQFGKYSTAEVLNALKRGDELPADVLRELTDYLGKNSNVLSRASQLAGASAAAAGTAAGTAGAASGQQPEGQQPAKTAESNQQPAVDQVAEQVLSDEDKAKLNRANQNTGDPQADSAARTAAADARTRRDQANNSLTNLDNKLRVSDSDDPQEAIEAVQNAQRELTDQLRSNGVPTDQIEQRVGNLMREHVQNMQQKYGPDHAVQWQTFSQDPTVQRILNPPQNAQPGGQPAGTPPAQPGTQPPAGT